MPRKTEPRHVKITRYVDADGNRVSADTPGARRIETESETYYATIGRKRISLKTTDLTQAWVNLRREQQRRSHEEAGIIDRWTEHARLPLVTHVEQWIEVVRAAGVTDRQADLLRGRVLRLADVAKWTRITDIESNNCTLALAKLQAEDDQAPQTRNHYLASIKQFCNWLHDSHRLREYPIGLCKPIPVEPDLRRARRELTAEELGRLLAAARGSLETVWGLDGPARAVLYAAACGSGFRAGSLGALTPTNFDLDASPPTITLAARTHKKRKVKTQALPADVAQLLREYLATRPIGLPMWPGTWASHRHAAAMLRVDLTAAGIPYRIDGPNGPLYADFHALRHTYLSIGGRAGIDLRTLQELAGHSTPKLTARYSHRDLADQAAALEKMPALEVSPPIAPVQKTDVIPPQPALPATDLPLPPAPPEPPSGDLPGYR